MKRLGGWSQPFGQRARWLNRRVAETRRGRRGPEGGSGGCRPGTKVLGSNQRPIAFTRRAYLLKCRRQRYPKSLAAVSFQYSNQDAGELALLTRSHWLIAGEFALGGTPCTVSVDGNVIEIVGPYLRSGALLLDDHIVNLDESVVVRLNGKAAFNATVERSVSFPLDWYAENRDRGDLYWNKISF